MLLKDFPQIPVRTLLLPHRKSYLNEILYRELIFLPHGSQVII